MFFRWLRQLFTGEPNCRHEYEAIRVFKVLWGETWVRTEYHLRCNHCGYICKRVL